MRLQKGLIFLLSGLFFNSVYAENATLDLAVMDEALNVVHQVNNGQSEPVCDSFGNKVVPELPEISNAVNGKKVVLSRITAPGCRSFVNDDGTMGPWGKEIVNYITKQGPNSVFLSNDLKGFSTPPRFCKNWKKLSVQKKKEFWAWTMAAIANTESTCKTKARNRNGTNTVAAGLLQLEEGYKSRSWRGGDCRTKASMYSAIPNIKCGMHIMDDLMKAKKGMYKSNGYLYGKKNNSYWEHLRHADGGKMGKVIRQIPFCNN